MNIDIIGFGWATLMGSFTFTIALIVWGRNGF